MDRYAVARLDELEANGTWLPIRRRFGIEAFGVNAWRADDGKDVIGEHDETSNRHQELYLVLEGHATFTVDGEEIDAPPGTLVAIPDVEVKRKAVANRDGTTIIAVGAPAGEPYELPAWEWNAEAIPFFGTGEYERAKEILLAGLERKADAGGILYNLACVESRLGNTDTAFDYLERAAEHFPRMTEFAPGDDDLASLRDDPRFDEILAKAATPA
jgi:tetratricopeptide (TPR) repeat protein